jgi:hypothetical protein
VRVGEFALAAAEPGKIKAQHRNAGGRKPLGDTLGGKDVLPAGKAMRKQRIGVGNAER